MRLCEEKIPHCVCNHRKLPTVIIHKTIERTDEKYNTVGIALNIGN